MNVVTVAGNLGRDAETRHTSSGDAVCSFSVADSQGKDKPTIWWRCSLWGKRAEALGQYLTKGSRVTVTGRATERTWTDKEGHERTTMEINVSDLALQGGGERDGAPRQERPQQSAPRQQQRPPADDPFGDDDIPF